MDDKKDSSSKSGTGRKKSTAKKAGRPALGGEGKTSPQIAFRVIPSTRRRAKEVAAQEGLSVSQLSRKALKQYLDNAPQAK